MGRTRAISRIAATIAIAGVVATSCSGSGGDPTTNRGTTRGTVPIIPNAGGTFPQGLKPPPPGATTLDGVRFKVDQIGGVFEPVAFTNRSGTTTLYVAQKDGRVKQILVDQQFDRDGNVKRVNYRVDNSPILDISRSVVDQGERGLLGVTFSSDGRRMYVDYTDHDGSINVDEYKMNDDRPDTRSRRSILLQKHPFPNHNGGQIAFGPDGFLYIAMGDGGSQGDPNGNGQNTSTLFGKILRVDPEGQTGQQAYAVPDGNPFKNSDAGLPEVWLFGVRNPWRFSWDKATGDLWIGDVGQDTYEEIDFLPNRQGGAGRGANLGWNLMEGTHPYQDGSPPSNYTPPIFDYGRTNGECSVTGGYVYRGKAIPALQGVYVYADYCNGEIRGLLRKPDNTLEEGGFGLRVPNGNLESGGSITSFGQDGDGEIFVLSAAGGIYKLDPP